MIQAALFHNRGIYDDLIRFAERSEGSPYTHVAFLVDGDTFAPYFLEAYPNAGVRQRMHEPADAGTYDLCNITGLTPEIEAKIHSFYGSTKGLPYSWIGIGDFELGRSDDSYNQWFCSKWVFEALRMAGIRALLRITCGRVRPSELSLSPLLPPAL